jgi:hypothetical protein
MVIDRYLEPSRCLGLADCWEFTEEITTMKTSNKTRTPEELKQKRFPTGQLCCYRTMLRKRFTQPAKPANLTAKSRKTRKWLKLVEFAAVGIATWLNPNAGFLIFLLKLCFQILELLQDERER